MNSLFFSSTPCRNGKVFFRGSISAMLLCIFALPALAQPAPSTARKQVYARVQQQAAEAIRQEAERHHWEDYQAKLNLFIPSEISQYAPCPAPLSVSMPGGEHLDLRRLRFDVRCEAGSGWDVAVTVKPDIYLQVLMAKETLERGHVLTASDLTRRKFNISNLRSGYITRPDDVVGLTLKRRVREFQPISQSQLDSPVMVERGQRVLMIAIQDGVEARTMGIASKKGRKGEMIKVKNESSERDVTAMVVDMGVVRTGFTTGR
ncbi:flagellar basal body P-ring formation protein FlgA [Enterobacter hormaechei]|uniref:flagellar basal body P-ring formation chaperone FlgA n=1 Tax=Enterobacter hormaechei TaxID=158836 RepID=UPI001889FA35|nr:flagellar basal body P-ring formation chaperone FlgA [Enterobacter hormaechei]MBF4167781.1 flagellar basal body P-ring formation protein FlgA [Enterobacter hormaechei]